MRLAAKVTFLLAARDGVKAEFGRTTAELPEKERGKGVPEGGTRVGFSPSVLASGIISAEHADPRNALEPGPPPNRACRHLPRMRPQGACPCNDQNRNNQNRYDQS